MDRLFLKNMKHLTENQELHLKWIQKVNIIQMKCYHAERSKRLQMDYQLDSDGVSSIFDKRLLAQRACWRTSMQPVSL